jgi:hypothetical protein
MQIAPGALSLEEIHGRFYMPPPNQNGQLANWLSTPHTASSLRYDAFKRVLGSVGQSLLLP